MATHTFLALEIKEARYLADLFGIEHDLQSSIEWCKRYLKLSAEQQLTWLIEPITIAILTRFIRAFGKGVRDQKALQLLDVLNDKEKEQYKYFKDVRDKHIAHSVNAFENNHVKAYYELEHPEKGINSIGIGSDRVIGLSNHDIEQISKICKKLLGSLNAEMAIEQKKLLNYLKRYTLDEVKKMKSYSSKDPKNINVSKRRK